MISLAGRDGACRRTCVYRKMSVFYSRAYITLRIRVRSSFKLRMQLAGGKTDAVVAGHLRSFLSENFLGPCAWLGQQRRYH